MVYQSSQILPPWVMDDIHSKAELGRYRIRGFSTFQRVTHFDDLTFLSTGLTRFPLEGYKEKCNTRTVIGHRYAEEPLVLETPIYISGMSYGALSANAKTALGKGAALVGSASCTGDGGMLQAERDAAEKLIYQVLPSRYGFDPHHLVQAQAVEIVVGQGAKPGTGGMLMGVKVLDHIAEMRDLPTGIDQRSPARHPDWLGPDDLAIKIDQLREATDHRVPIHVKLGACRVMDDVKLAAKAGADAGGDRQHGRGDRRVGRGAAGPQRDTDGAGDRAGPGGAEGDRHVRRGEPDRVGRHPQRGRRGEGAGAGSGRGGHRHRRAGVTELQPRHTGGGLRGRGWRARGVLRPLPHGEVPRGHHDAGPGPGEAAGPRGGAPNGSRTSSTR